MRHLFAAALIGCVVVSIPASAEAQLGIGRKIKNAATRAAGGEGGSSESVRTGSVRFNDQVLEITEARLAQFMKGLEAEAQMAARVEAQDTEGIERSNKRAQDEYDRKNDEYHRKSEAWDRCARPIEDRSSSQMQAYGAAAVDSVALQKVAERIKAAQQRGDMTELRRLADSVGSASMAVANKGQAMSQSANDEIARTCGARPAEPEKPTLQTMLTFHDVRRAGLDASGFDDAQYSIMRERIVPFVVSGGKNSGGMIYAEAEAAALSAQLTALTKYTEVLKSY